MSRKASHSQAGGLVRMSVVLNEIARDLRNVTAHDVAFPSVEPITLGAPLFADDSAELLQHAEHIYGRRRRWEREFDRDSDLLHDPALDILLYLFIGAQRHSDSSVSSVCYASSAPQTTALRYITKLEQRGLIIRSDDPFDRRRQLLSLTANGRALMGRCLKAS